MACKVHVGLSSPRFTRFPHGSRFAGFARSIRFALLGSALFVTPTSAHADAVLAPAAEADPTVLDVELAVASGTRWTRLHVGGPSRVMWLVPARPGAAIDWAPDGWLDALEQATAPRVVSPDASPPCGMPSATDRITPLGGTASTRTPSSIVVESTEAAARAHLAARGFAVSAAAGARIAQIYADGGSLVSVELDAAGGVSTPTLRVTDGGPALLPLALTGSANATTQITAFVVADGAVSVPNMTDLDTSQISWGQAKSSYPSQRVTLLASGGWLRESASHEALWTGFAVPRDEPVASAVDLYFHATNADWTTCSSAAHGVAWLSTPVGRTCAPGLVARIPGGGACVAATGPVDPAALTCGASLDLALALDGLTPARATITRLSGTVARADVGEDVSLSASFGSVSPVATAARYGVCAVTTSPPATGADDTPSGGSSGTAADVIYVTTSQGCSGDTTSSTTDVPDDTTAASDTSSSTGCNGDTSTSTSSTDSSTSSDNSGCGGDSSTSSSSGESSSSSSSSSSSDSQDPGWDTKDSSSSSSDSCGSSTSNAAPKQARRKRSPVSRYAMFFAFLVLPLRRRLRRFR